MSLNRAIALSVKLYLTDELLISCPDFQGMIPRKGECFKIEIDGKPRRFHVITLCWGYDGKDIAHPDSCTLVVEHF